jgi:hypothetical protein
VNLFRKNGRKWVKVGKKFANARKSKKMRIREVFIVQQGNLHEIIHAQNMTEPIFRFFTHTIRYRAQNIFLLESLFVFYFFAHFKKLVLSLVKFL